MDSEDILPGTLLEAVTHFQAYENCHRFMMVLRWPDGKVKCPRCGSENVSYLPNARVFKCYEKHDRQKFSLKVGTIFEDSPLGLDKWLPVMWQLVNCKNGVSSWEIHRAIGVTQKSAWFMLQRGRLALQDPESGGKLAGEIEIDETWIGGKQRNMHKARKIEVQKDGRNTGGKTAVIAVLERKGQVRATVSGKRTAKAIQKHIREHVQAGSAIFSDEFADNYRMDAEYKHEVVNHAVEYVHGQVHCNGVENFWSLLKRSLGGTYISVEPFHLFRYVDEQAFRFNNRKDADGELLNDSDRFVIAMRQIVGRRLTWKQLIGKEGETSVERSEAF